MGEYIELLLSKILPFRMKNSLGEECGDILTNLNRDGNVSKAHFHLPRLLIPMDRIENGLDML